MTVLWPLTGRGQELAELQERISSGQSVIVSGPAGIGKSRLIDEALVGHSGSVVLRVAATAAVVGIPLGPFGSLLPLQQSGANLLSWAIHGIVEHSVGKPLLLVVDDLHLLDPTSAAVVYQLVFGESARLVGTLRTGEAAPHAVVALWKDGLAERVELAPLAASDVSQLAEAVLGGPLDQHTTERLSSLSEGLPLLLRELVLGALVEATLREDGDWWHWDGAAPSHPRLAELVEQRLGRLEAPERRALELVALGEPLEVPALVALTGTELAESLEEKGLIRIRRSQRRLHAAAGHPLYAEMARANMPELRRRRFYQDLANAVDATGARRQEDALRVTLWRLDAGVVQEPLSLLAAYRLAWAARDQPLAERLARAAVAAGGGADATAALVEVLVSTERWHEAGELIRSVWDQELAQPLRAQLTLRLAWVHAYGDGDLAGATALLDAAEAELSDPTAQHTITIQRIGFLGDAGRFAEAGEMSAQLLSRTGLTTPQWADVFSGLGLCCAMTGRTADAVRMADSFWAQRASWIETDPELITTLGYTRVQAAIFAGDLAAAEAAIEWEVGEKGQAYLFAEAHLQRDRAAVLRMRGRPASALDVATRGVRDDSMLGSLSYAEAAHDAALLNDLPRARALRARVVIRPVWSWAELIVGPSDVWLAAQSGLITEAVQLALDLADRVAAVGMIGLEMVVRHDVVRLDAAERVVERLAEIATIHDGRLAPVIAAHATAAVRHDALALLQVADGFEELGMMLYAAEAAAQAARAHADSGQTRGAAAATTRAQRLAEQCEGARTPALIGMQAPQLSRREYEIGRLAACGHSNKEIAAKLYVSLRTVENHLHSVFAKHGITRRDELTALLR